MSIMFNSMSSWLGGEKPSDHQVTESEAEVVSCKTGGGNVNVENTDNTSTVRTTTTSTSTSSSPSRSNSTAASVAVGEDHGSDLPDLNEVSAKAISTAKEWGSYLFNVGKAATKTVTKTALQLKDKTPLFNEFEKEQEKFVTEKKEKKRQAEAAVPPWVGYNEEEAMMEQILALSLDKRNFLRNPPAGVQFMFDFESSFPIAMATLQEDAQLNKMRFDLVPKLINEESFWRNYFYRVSLIKQSTQLTTLAQQSGSASEGQAKSNDSSRRSSLDNGQKGDSSSASSSDYDKLTDIQEHRTELSSNRACKPDEIPTGSSPLDNEFVSDAFQSDNISEDEIRKEMLMLGMSGENDRHKDEDENLPEWEKELQQELQDYEMVDDGADDADIEKEILEQLENESVEQS